MDQIIHALYHKIVSPETRDFNFDALQAEETDGDTVVNIASSFPLMSERRFLVLRSIQKFSVSDKKRILAYVHAPLSSTCLLITANDADRRQTFYQDLSSSAYSFECKPLYENQASEWVERQVRTKGSQISPEAAVLLVQQAGTSLWNLENEIEKLLTFSYGKKNLDRTDVEAVSGFSRKYNLWDLTDAVGGKNFRRAFVILRRFLEEKASVAGLIIDLSRRVLLLLQIRAMLDKNASPQAIAAALRLKPFFLNLYLPQARFYSLDELHRANRTLLEADFSVKTGRLPHQTAMVLALYDVIRGKTSRCFFIEDWQYV